MDLESVYFFNIGCFKGKKARTIPSLEGQDPLLDGNYTTRNYAIERCGLVAKKRGHKVFVVMSDGQCASGPNIDSNFLKSGYSKSECSTMAAVNNGAYVLGYPHNVQNVKGTRILFICRVHLVYWHLRNLHIAMFMCSKERPPILFALLQPLHAKLSERLN